MHQRSNRWRRINGAIASLTGSFALTTAWFPLAAHAAELTGWQFDPATQQLQVTIPAGTTPRYFLLAQPARIVLDLPNTQVGNVPPQQSFGGVVRQIRVGQFDATSTRIVIELSPDAELAPRQVELQQASSTQWVLRPLLADSSIAERSQNGIAAQPTPNSIAAVPPSPTIAPPAVPPIAAPAIAPSPVAPAVLPPIVPSVSPPATLPPLEPNAIEIPIEPAAIVPPPAIAPSISSANATVAPFEADVTAIDPTETTVLPSASATSTVALNAPPAPSVRLPDRPAEPDLPARDPIMLPPAIDPRVQTAPAQPLSVPDTSIAPVQPASVAPPTIQAAAPIAIPFQERSAIELPPALPAQNSPAQVTVPPLNSAPPARQLATPANNVEFGQPPPALPLTARRSSVLLPAGTVLSLRYPREAAIEIEAGRPRQEVLILQNAIRDAAGATILPAGTQVIGRFEVDRSGSRFVAQAVSMGDRNIRLNGASALLGSDRSASSEDLIVHSAIGALALTLLGGFSGLGLLGGAAAGAATTYLEPPDAIVIQPNQVFEVRLTEDVPQ